MKIRNGFVSNSSSSSFCIYGWKCKTYEEKDELVDRLKQHEDDNDCEITYSNTELGEYVVGVGHTACDMDHYMEDWEDFKCESPNKEKQKKLKKIGRKLKLSVPKMYSETFYD